VKSVILNLNILFSFESIVRC